MASKQTKVVLTTYYAPKPGGLCTRYFRAISALLDRGHTVHYLSCVKFPIDHPNCIHHRFFWPNEKPDGLIFWLTYYSLAPLYLLFIGLKYKPSHGFSFHPSYGYMLKFGMLFSRSPLTIFYRADPIKNHQIKKKKKWIVSLDTIIERLSIHSSKLIFISRSCQYDICSRHGHIDIDETAVLYNDIILPTEAPQHHQQKTLHISSVGILEERKNQSLIIRSLSTLKGLDFTYNIYGTGDQHDQLKREIETHELQKYVFLHGWTDRREIWEKTRLLLLPSIHEGVSNALLEAISHNIAVLASNIPEHKEILPSELLVNLDEQSWAHEIKNAITTEKRLEGIRHAQHSTVQKLTFDWDSEICKLILNEK